MAAGPATMREMRLLRSRAVALAVVLGVVAIGGGIALMVATGQVIFLAFALILAIAPWASVIDDVDRRR